MTNERFTFSENSMNSEIRDSPMMRHLWCDELDSPFFLCNGAQNVAASGIRAVIRDHNADMIPHIHGFIRLYKANKYGDTFLIEVQYSKQGWRAVYGGHLEPGQNQKYAWQCYMD